MNGVGGKAGWSWIFIIEGLLTLVAGLASPWLVQDWPDQKTKFLTPLEKQMVLERLKADTGLASQGTFNMGVVKRAALDWKTWLFMFAYIGVAMPIYSQSIFTPTIIQVCKERQGELHEANAKPALVNSRLANGPPRNPCSSRPRPTFSHSSRPW